MKIIYHLSVWALFGLVIYGAVTAHAQIEIAVKPPVVVSDKYRDVIVDDKKTVDEDFLSFRKARAELATKNLYAVTH